MNVLVTGGEGQLALCIQKEAAKLEFAHQFFYLDKAALDITQMDLLEDFIRQKKIEAIINTAAFTAVDLAEEQPAQAFAINESAVKNLGALSKRHHIRLIHISTDYVFDGKHCKPYTRTDAPKPINTYGRSKRAGEQALEAINPANSCILRTSWLYSEFHNNFLTTMLRLGKEQSSIQVVDDQIGSPTYAGDLAHFILNHALSLKATDLQLFQYTNEGVASWYDFAVAIMEVSQSETVVHPIPGAQFPTKAQRPSYSVLDKTELKAFFDCRIPHWRSSLAVCYDALITVNA